MIIASCFHLLLVLFEILLCIHLEYNVAGFRVVFIPIYFMSFMAIVGCVWGYRHERQLEVYISYIQGGSQKLLLKTKESIVSNSIFPGPPCIAYRFILTI